MLVGEIPPSLLALGKLGETIAWKGELSLVKVMKHGGTMNESEP